MYLGRGCRGWSVVLLYDDSRRLPVIVTYTTHVCLSSESLYLSLQVVHSTQVILLQTSYFMFQVI